MDKPISVGDVVVVVRGPDCCGSTRGALGLVFTVTELDVAPFAPCVWCGKVARDLRTAVSESQRAFFLHRLKRIPPLDELEDVRQDEEITA